MRGQRQSSRSYSSLGSKIPHYNQPLDKYSSYLKEYRVTRSYMLTEIKQKCVFQSQINNDFFQFLRPNLQSKILNSSDNTILMQKFLDEWMNKFNLKQHANQFLNKILLNLVSFNSLYQHLNLYSFAHIHNKNIQKLLMFGSQYLKTQNLPLLNKENKYLFGANENQMIKDLLAHIQQEYQMMSSYFNENTTIEDKIKLILQGQMIKESINHLLQVLSISDALQQSIQPQQDHGQIIQDTGNSRNRSKSQIVKNVSNIFLFKLIKAKLLEIFSDFKYEIHNLDKQLEINTNLINYCKLIAKKSGISNFLQVQIQKNSQLQKKDQIRIYQESSSIKFDDFFLQKIWIEGVGPKNNGIPCLDKLFIYQIDLLKFVQKILLYGLKIEIKTDNLLIKNDSLQYKIDKIFTISKSKDQLKQSCPSLYSFIKQYQLNHREDLAQIYCDSQISSRRKEHFIVTQNNIKLCLQRPIFNQLQNSAISSSIMEYINPKTPYIQQEIDDLQKIYAKIKVQLKILKDQDENDFIKKDIFECKQDIIQYILSSVIDIIGFLIFKKQTKLPYSQYLIFLKSLQTKESYSDQIIASLLKGQEKSLKAQIILQLAKKLENINKNFDTGIIGVQTIVQDYTKIGIDLEYLNPRQHIFLSQLNPETAKDYILKACLPLPHKSIQTKQSTKPFTYNHAYQVTRKFVKNIEISFSNLSKKQIRSPLFLTRHFSIKNIQNEKNFPIIYPKLNIMSCFLDSIFLNSKKLPNIITQFYISKEIHALNLPIEQHNYLIFFIFMLLIHSKKSEHQFLLHLDQFFRFQLSQELKKSAINIIGSKQILRLILKQLYIYLNDKQNSHPFPSFQRMTTTTIITIYKQQIKKRFKNLKININNQLQQLYELELDIYTEGQLAILKQKEPHVINKTIGNIQGEQVSGFFIFKLNKELKYYKKHHYKYEQGKDETQNKKNEILLQLNYINTKYLFNQLFNKPFKYIPPIIKFSSLIQNNNPPHLQYIAIIQQPNNPNIQNTNQNNFFDKLQYFNNLTNEFHHYLGGVDSRSKILFMKKLIQIAEYCNSLKIHILNLNIFSIKRWIDPNQQIQIAKFNDIPFCYVLAEGLQRTNYKLFGQYFSLCSPQQKNTQDNFTLSSYPPFLWLFQKPQLLFSIIDFPSKYDVGHLGYIICSLFYFQKDPGQHKYLFDLNPEDQQCYFHSFYNGLRTNFKLSSDLPQLQYKAIIKQIHTNLNELHQRFRNRYQFIHVNQLQSNAFRSFIFKLIHPQIRERFSAKQALAQFDNR